MYKSLKLPSVTLSNKIGLTATITSNKNLKGNIVRKRTRFHSNFRNEIHRPVQERIRDTN